MYRTTISSSNAFLKEGALSRRRFLRVAAGTVSVLVGAGLLLPIRAWADDQPIRTTSPIVDFATRSIVLGFSTLTRTEEGVSIQVHARNLTPGAYTFWMGVTDPDGTKYGGRVGDHVVNGSGTANVKAEAEVGEIVGDFHIPGTPLQAAPLRDPLTSTILVVLRQQLHTFQEGVPGVYNYGITIHMPSP